MNLRTAWIEDHSDQIGQRFQISGGPDPVHGFEFGPVPWSEIMLVQLTVIQILDPLVLMKQPFRCYCAPGIYGPLRPCTTIRHFPFFGLGLVRFISVLVPTGFSPWISAVHAIFRV